MKTLEKLFKIIKTLRSEDGCPWDKMQTLCSLDKLFLEECFELSEAIHQNNSKEITEELGDVTFMILLMVYIAEQDNICESDIIFENACQKLIFRHPHIFGQKRLSNPDEVVSNWEALKKQEKPERISIFDGFPKALPDIMYFDKLMRKLKNNGENLEEYKSLDNCQKAKLKNILIEFALDKNDLTKIIRELNAEVEMQARKKGL